MSPIKSWRRFRIMRSVSEARSARSGRIDAETLEQIETSATSRLQPDLIQPQNVFVGMRVRSLADLVQSIHHRLEFRGQLAEDFAQYAPTAPRHGVSECRIRSAAHGDAIVDVNQLAGKALREKTGNEQRDIA